MPLGLSRTDAETAVFATVLLPLLTLGLRWAGFRRMHGLVTRSARRPARVRPGEEAVTRARRLAAMLDLASRRTSLLVADCLPRSLALWLLCRRAGLPADFRLGVRTLTGRFEAHAWVEVAGVPIGEEESVERIYSVFDLDVGSLSS